MFCGRYNGFMNFVAFGDTVDEIFEAVCEQNDAAGAQLDLDVEDLEYFQCFPVFVRNSGYQFVDPQTEETLS